MTETVGKLKKLKCSYYFGNIFNVETFFKKNETKNKESH